MNKRIYALKAVPGMADYLNDPLIYRKLRKYMKRQIIINNHGGRPCDLLTQAEGALAERYYISKLDEPQEMM
jgi:hypothetical protein